MSIHLYFDYFRTMVFNLIMALGKKIKELRTARKLSQDALSQLTGGVVSQGVITTLEQRDSKSSSFAPQLAHALGVSLEYLLSDTEIQVSDDLIAPTSKKEVFMAKLNAIEFTDELMDVFLSVLKLAGHQTKEFEPKCIEFVIPELARENPLQEQVDKIKDRRKVAIPVEKERRKN